MKQNKTFLHFLRLMGNRLPIYLLSIFVMTAMNALFDVIGSIFAKQIFDIAQNGDKAAIYYVLPMNVAAALISITVAAVFMNIYNNEAKRISIQMKRKVFAKSMRLPMSYFDTHHSGDLISRLVFDTDKACEIYSSRLRRVLAPIISVIVYVIAMILINPFMTLVLILLNIFLIFINLALSKPMKQVAREIAAHNAFMTEKLSNLIAGMEICKIYDNYHKTEAQYIYANGAYVKAQKREMFLDSLLESFHVGFDLLCALMFLVVGIFFLKNHMITIGGIAAIYTMYGALSFRFLQMGKYFPELINCIAYAERIFEFLNEAEENDIMNPADEKTVVEEIINEASQKESAVEVKKLMFSYDENHKVFEGKSFVIPQNRNIVLTGKSGCGKSTFAKLLLGFYPYDSGDIKLFGNSMKTLGIEKVRNLIAYVPQEPYLFGVSIMENIRYGRLAASDEEVMEAAKKANAHDFILKQKNGYHTIVSNRGQSLSGGERQRVAIARAILKDAPIFLFDEATSALDNESERLIQKAILEMRENRTVIMIAHRKATIALADVEIAI